MVLRYPCLAWRAIDAGRAGLRHGLLVDIAPAMFVLTHDSDKNFHADTHCNC
jgi:hypothetical protein